MIIGQGGNAIDATLSTQMHLIVFQGSMPPQLNMSIIICTDQGAIR
jgi:hypothetical protein